MKITIIFDDVLIADPALHDLFGVVHFGALMFQRRKRCDAMAEIAALEHQRTKMPILCICSRRKTAKR